MAVLGRKDMKLVVIGGVAAGTKAAAKAKRQDRSAEVVIFTKSSDISYAGCGVPYYIGGVIPQKEELIVNTPEKYTSLTGAAVHTGKEAVCVDPQKKTVTLRDVASGEMQEEDYDKLVLATGAVPFVPESCNTGLEGVFTVRTPFDAEKIRTYIEKNSCKKAVVVGGGFIGLEVAENLQAKGLQVTVAEATSQIMPNLLDPDMADYAKRQLQERGIRVLTGSAITGIEGEKTVSAVLTGAVKIPADLVVLAVGIRPATEFLNDIGLEMVKGTIVVNEKQETNLPDIYAAGDCAIVKNAITGKMQWSAMGSTANLTGRCLAKNLTGEEVCYGGTLGTGVVRLADDLNVGRTGLTQAQAKEAGFDPVSVLVEPDDKPHYYPGASNFVTRLIADRSSHKLLGLQVIGAGTVDKMVDIAVCGLSMGAALEQFDTMDFSYAPPFSTAIHPFVQACYVLENKLDGTMDSITPQEYAEGAAKGFTILDLQPQPAIPGAKWVDLGKLDGPIPGIAPDEKLLLVCNRGRRAYLAQNRLKAFGYTNTKVLEGGATFSRVKAEVTGKLSPEEIKRVKGLGCLQDKRYPDVFNVRVITRNGRLTSEEQRTVADAAEKFGSGAVTMTTRLTLEIQGVPYRNIQDLIDYLKEAGLSTGGTGSLVRPIVACKGTTCQYGLLDSFGLSEKLHERFYVGYHNVTLPHKFKIAVGGCPNNCVKPDLNDLGIVGQRVPVVDRAKCRGCKKCQVEAGCPIHAVTVENGKVVINEQACNHCGRCRNKCPFGALEDFKDGYRIYLGGRWGKRVAHGHMMDHLFTSEEEVMDMVEKAILLFRDEGITGERFADTIDRLGFDYVQEKLLSSAIDKTEILKKSVTGGASC